MFENIQGHNTTKTYLQSMVAVNALPSCLLFHGPVGVGKRSLALELAKRLNCTGGKTAGCTCPSCKKIGSGDHLDVFLYQPDGDTFKIDQARLLVEESNRYRMEGNWRVFILDGAEKLGMGAADALLKTLEDGRPNTVFILISSSKASLVPTLASRSLDFFMGSLTYEECQTVMSNLGMAPEEEHLRLGNGSVEATQFFMGSGLELRDSVVDLLAKYPSIEDYRVLSFVKDKESVMDQVMAMAETIFVDLLTLHITQNKQLIRNCGTLPALEVMLTKWGWDRCLRATYALLHRADSVSLHQSKSLLLSLKDILR